MRLYLLLSLLGTAHADPGDGEFMATARQAAQSHDLRVEAWWSAELDGDRRPERIARLCARDERTGWFLIQAGPRLHWLRFSVDGRTPWCRGAGQPRFRHTHDRSLVHHQGNHSTIETVRVALRDGEPAIIWREHDYRPHCSEERTDVVDDFREDWDARVATRITRRYGMRAGRILAQVSQKIAVCGGETACPAEDEADGSNGDRSGFIGLSVERERARVYQLEGRRYPRPDEAVVARLESVAP